MASRNDKSKRQVGMASRNDKSEWRVEMTSRNDKSEWQAGMTSRNDKSEWASRNDKSFMTVSLQTIGSNDKTESCSKKALPVPGQGRQSLRCAVRAAGGKAPHALRVTAAYICRGRQRVSARPGGTGRRAACCRRAVFAGGDATRCPRSRRRPCPCPASRRAA